MHTPTSQLAALVCGFSLSCITPTAFAEYVDPVEKPETPSEVFVLGAAGYEQVELVDDRYIDLDMFEITQAGTYELTLTDMFFPGALRRLHASVFSADEKLADVFGPGSTVFELDAGTYYLGMFAKAKKFGPGTFGLTLQLQDNVMETPVPGALWLFGSGLVGLAGLVRRRHPQ